MLLRCGLAALAVLLTSTAAHSAVVFHGTKAAFDAAATTTLIEDFEAFTPKDVNLSATFSTGFLTFQAYDPPNNPNLVVASPGYTNFGAGLNPTTSSVLTTSGDENFEMFFLLAQTAVGFEGYLNGLGPGTVTVKNGAVVLDVYNLPNPTAGLITYIGIVSDTPFTSVIWDTTAGGSLNTAIDNISVGAVPEPSSWALLLAGVLGFGALMRRGAAVARG